MNRSERDLRAALILPKNTAAEGRLTALIHTLDDEDTLEPARPIPRAGRPVGHGVRWALVAASVAVVGLATALGIVVIGSGGRDGTATAARPAASSGVRPPSSAATNWRWQPAHQTLVGRLITTDVPYQSGRLVLSFGRDAAGGVALNAGVTAGGTLRVTTLTIASAPTAGADPLGCVAHVVLDTGFHCGDDVGGVGTDRHAFLLVGVVVGADVAKVRIAVDGRTYTAGTAAWSDDPRVHVYWLPGAVLKNYPAKGSGVGTVGAMTAYDAKGNVVARAHGAIAHG